MQKLRIGGVTFVAVVAASVAWGILFAGPSVHLAYSNNELRVDTKFLGEYCIGLSEVSLLAPFTEQAVWSLRPVTPPYMNLCEFSLSVGVNSAVSPVTDAVTVVPADAPTFTVLADTPYVLKVCGNNGSARDRCSRQEIQLR